MNRPFNPTAFATRITRRAFLGRGAGVGLGGFALAQMLLPHLARGAASAPSVPQTGRWPGLLNPPHLPQKAKRVIHLCMAGGPSHLETFDFKPELKKLHGQPFP